MPRYRGPYCEPHEINIEFVDNGWIVRYFEPPPDSDESVDGYLPAELRAEEARMDEPRREHRVFTSRQELLDWLGKTISEKPDRRSRAHPDCPNARPGRDP